MRCWLLLLLIAVPGLQAATPTFSQCAELPYGGMPRQLWERELVWMKNVGVECVALNDSSDLPALLGTVRKLDLSAWILVDQPTAALRISLDPLTESHGGPVRWIGRDAAPQPVLLVRATDPNALATSRLFLEKQKGTLLWTDLETTVTPALHRGAITFTGEESPTLNALRRNLLLTRQWRTLIGELTTEQSGAIVSGKVPDNLSARQFTTSDSAAASLVSLINSGKTPFRGELRVMYPPVKQSIKLPEISVPAGDSLWLPVNVPLAKAQSCHACTPFGNGESIVYATAEMTKLEYENGILAMEFCASSAGEVVLQLNGEPVGPYLAAGVPRTFDWDSDAGRARLQIPAGTGPTHRVRVGLAIRAPEHSAFFGEQKVLTIGQKNVIHATFSSESVKKRSRLIAPSWLQVNTVEKSPNELEYALIVPPFALHGSHVDLALETDGVQVSHTRLQLLRAASLRVREAVSRHLGVGLDLAMDPPMIPVDQKAGRDISITVRNNSPDIRTFAVELSGESLEFAQPRTEVVVAGSSERDVTVRIFAEHATAGLHPATVRLTGGATSELPIRLLVIPRGETVRYTDGSATVLESQRARAVFTDTRWTEFVWKDSERNLLPEGGVDLTHTRVVDLRAAELTMEGQAVGLKPGKQGDINLSITPLPSGGFAYGLSR